MKACIHLDYEGQYRDCTIEKLDGFDCDFKYWKRGKTWTGGGNPEKVQFCKKRGRINEMFCCYNGEMSCYET